MRTRRANGAIAVGLIGVILGMVGASYAAIPLYRKFCQLTGYAGTPEISGRAAPGAVRQSIVVRFNADTNPGLPWRFAPSLAQVRVELGEDRLATYQAHNLADVPVTGVALYNVTPEKIGKYFHKTACFCFNEQTLQAGQEMEFPLSFWVDPAIASDPNTADVHTITLSYTFYRSMDDAERNGALAKTGPHIGPLVAR